MLDIDDTDKTLEEVCRVFSSFKYVIYSSPSCTKHKLKLRVVLKLDKRAPHDKLTQLWYSVQMWLNGLVDEQTKDMARIFYIPAKYTNKGDNYRHFFLTNDGIDLPWEQLMEKYPSPPPEDKFRKDNPLRGLKRKIFENNNSLPNLDITADDCPFVYKSMIDDYRMTAAGEHNFAIYKFMVRVAYNAQAKDYPISQDELADMGQQLDQLDGGFYDYSKMLYNAKNAMEFVGI